MALMLQLLQPMPYRYRTLVTTATIAIALAGPSAALAQAPGEFRPQPLAVAPTPPATIERSYRMQLLTVDILSVAAIYLGVGSEFEGVARLGAVGLVLAAPAVHVFHDNGSSALKSAGLRLGLPCVGALIGARTNPGLPGVLMGGGIGVVTALIIDYTVLGKKTEKAPASWQPTIGASSTSFSVGAAGHF